MKQAQVIWSAEALVDLEVIYDFLADKSPSTAQQVIRDILERSKQLEDFPESGPRQELGKKKNKEYRFLVEGNYKIVYSYQSESRTVHIEIIFDTRFNPEKLKL